MKGEKSRARQPIETERGSSKLVTEWAQKPAEYRENAHRGLKREPKEPEIKVFATLN